VNAAIDRSQIPLTIPTLRVAKILNQTVEGADEALESRLTLKDWWKKNPTAVQVTSKSINLVAEQLCPGDPAKADYPFFILGRRLSGLELNGETLIKTLALCEQQGQELWSISDRSIVMAHSE
jgi:hypothetical protein